MRRLSRREHQRVRDDSGMTLVELMIAMPIALMALGLVFALIVVTTNIEGDGVALGRANGNVDNAVNAIKQDVINANVIFNPATEGPRAGVTIKPGFSLRMLTMGSGSEYDFYQ